jgi:hypothetical protein
MVRVTVDIDDELYLKLLRVALKKYKKKRGALGLVLSEAIKLYLSEVEGGTADKSSVESAGPASGATAVVPVGVKKSSSLETYVREVYYKVAGKLDAKPGSRVPVKRVESILADIGKDPSWIGLFEKYGLVKVEGEDCVLVY